jgi:uncharacterized membrane protein (DUF4010 family)
MGDASIANLELLERLATALAVGLLIGLERGWERRELAEGQRAAGLRTFGIVGLLGGLSAQLGSGVIIPAVVAGGVSLLAALGYWRESLADRDVSLTSAAAMLLTFCLGAFAGRGQLAIAASAAVIVTILLGFKPELHGLLRRIERDELLATLRLLLISVVLLPVLPNRGFGPWNAFNPFQVWWMVVLVAGVSYIGYFAIKLLGTKRGALLMGLCGGLISSTAATLDLARYGEEDPDAALDVLTAAIAVATAIMFPRILVIVGAVAPYLARRLLWPMLLACLTSLLAAAWYIRRDAAAGLPHEEAPHELGNPLDLYVAFRFGLALAVVMVLARGAIQWMGDQGLYLLAAVSALIDADPISLSVAAMTVHGQVGIEAAANTVLIAAIVNTLLKPVLVMAVGGARMAWRVSVAVAVTLLAAASGVWMPLVAPWSIR